MCFYTFMCMLFNYIFHCDKNIPYCKGVYDEVNVYDQLPV